MIEVDQLTKRYGRFTAVRDVSFRVDAGESVALWGANGAGKTTILRCLLGLLRYRGGARIAGHDARRAGKAARRLLGYVPQELAFDDDLRLPAMLHLFARLKRAPAARVETVLELVGLAEHRRKRVGELSGGMKQRLALANALLADPPLLLLDEMTASLDRAARHDFVKLLVGLRDAGKTILFTSHRVEEMHALAHRVLVLDGGRLDRACSADDLGELPGALCTIRLELSEPGTDAAIAVLRGSGLTASCNGHGLLVEVPRDAKARPFSALAEARIAVRDFEITDRSGGEA